MAKDRLQLPTTFFYVWTLFFLLTTNVAYSSSEPLLGQEECAACHKQNWKSFVTSRHGKIAALNDNEAVKGPSCETCHGSGVRHVDVVGELDYKGPLLIENFKNDVTATSKICLGCHESGDRAHWRSSTHSAEGLGCTSCHAIHGDNKKVGKSVCANCHPRHEAKLQRTEHMPMREGMLTCMDCHNPHGGTGPSQLRAASVNETCYRCHAEKRGPMLFEHPPVRENCANCHEPHGSNHAYLLKNKAPYLCQGCHQAPFHPSSLYEGSQLADRGKPARQLVIKGCMNCHSQIHGSNHPSGARFQR